MKETRRNDWLTDWLIVMGSHIKKVNTPFSRGTPGVIYHLAGPSCLLCWTRTCKMDLSFESGFFLVPWQYWSRRMKRKMKCLFFCPGFSFFTWFLFTFFFFFKRPLGRSSTLQRSLFGGIFGIWVKRKGPMRSLSLVSFCSYANASSSTSGGVYLVNPFGIFVFMLFTPNISGSCNERDERDGVGTKTGYTTPTPKRIHWEIRRKTEAKTQRERLETTEAIDQHLHLHLHLEIVALYI